MVLKQFELIDHKNYQLQIKETLTLKPEGFTMQVRPRVRQSRFVFHTAEKAGNDAKLTEKVILPTFETHGTFLLVLYGSNMGTAEGRRQNLSGTDVEACLQEAYQNIHSASREEARRWLETLQNEGALCQRRLG